MKKTHQLLTLLTALLLLGACENKDINDGEAFQPREIHEDIVFHFDKINVDGIEYLILEKDNNNPHEGFGFMAFRANKLMEKQDTIMAYIQTINEVQTRIYARLYNKSLADAESEVNALFNENLSKERQELEALEKTDLSSTK